jgi:hypothetical protein
LTQSERKWLIEQMTSQRRRPARAERTPDPHRAHAHDAAAPSPVAASTPPVIDEPTPRTTRETTVPHDTHDPTSPATPTPDHARRVRPRVPEDSFWSFG